MSTGILGVERNGNCYWINTEAKPWLDASADCQARGGGWLATITSDAEHTEIISTEYVRAVGSATMILPMKEHSYGKWVGMDTPSGVQRNLVVDEWEIVCILLIWIGCEMCGMMLPAPIVKCLFVNHVPSEPFLDRRR